MALPISFDFGYLAPDVDLDEVKSFQDNVNLAHQKVTQGGGLGSDFLGWVDPAKIVSPDEVNSIKTLAAQIQDSLRCADFYRHRWVVPGGACRD